MNQSGAVGMDSMIMPFDLAPAVPLDGIAVGDKVEAALAVDWSRPSYQIERIQKLPASTVLRFGKAEGKRP